MAEEECGFRKQPLRFIEKVPENIKSLEELKERMKLHKARFDRDILYSLDMDMLFYLESEA